MGGELYWLATEHDQEPWMMEEPCKSLKRLLGIEVVEAFKGRSIVRLEVHPCYMNLSRRTLQECVYAALAHRSMCNAVRSTGKKAVTMNLHIGYVRPVDIGQIVECEGKIIHNGQKIVVAEARMLADGYTIATAGGIFCVDGSYCPG